MSVSNLQVLEQANASHGSDHGTDHDASHGDVKSYLIGFVLSVLLTVVPFALVMHGGYSQAIVLWSVVSAAVVQIWVHLKYFLHLNFITEEGKASSIAFIFSASIIVMVVGLSVWIIYESNAMMMY
ncbi:cytochrome o ubiquinol oxidase subunit IV [Neptunicella sp. SCSIO 80796]|uniref:cytochrome o ubiquinol oxidase subunit IV n=1 Tax=Neptunicella plasticusilytica TaxID=3117012 RepID=UPI003A4D489B